MDRRGGAAADGRDNRVHREREDKLGRRNAALPEQLQDAAQVLLPEAAADREHLFQVDRRRRADAGPGCQAIRKQLGKSPKAFPGLFGQPAELQVSEHGQKGK